MVHGLDVLASREGTACADVLVAGEKGGAMAKLVFGGLGVAMIYKLFNTVLGFFKEVPEKIFSKTSALPNATVNCEIVPEYLGVGYIIGPKISGIMVSGSILGWMALTPLLSMFVPEETLHQQLRSLSFSDHWIASHGLNEQFYRAYIRLIGAGAVAMAGLMSLARTLPTIWASFRDSVKSLSKGAGAGSARRTESDIPISVVLIGSAVLAIGISLFMPGLPTRFPGSLLLAVLIIVFGFFFVTVSSRIVGIIGTTSNPISGMTIATIMGTCMLFISVGWSRIAYQTAALAVGAFLPCSPTKPIFVGGFVRFIVERLSGREESETEVSSGMLYSTGLVAGGSVAGVLIAALSAVPTGQGRNLLEKLSGVGDT